MAAITWVDVVGIYPAASTISAAGQSIILEMVADQCNESAWRTRHRAGQIYLAAHYAALTITSGGTSGSGGSGGGGGGAGPVTSESVGQLSVSYANLFGGGAGSGGGASASSLDLTPFGQEYKRLSRILPTVMGAVT